MIRIRVKHTSRNFDLDRALTIIVKDFAAVSAKEARALISGNTPQSQLTAEGHPFGRGPARGNRRGPQRGTAPRLPINYQSGDLWRHLAVPVHRYGFTLGFPNTPSAWVLAPGGTRAQVARGFAYALFTRVQPKLRQSARDVVPRSLESGL